MNTFKIKNSFFWILTLILLVGPTHQALAQKARAHSARRSSEKKVERKQVERKNTDHPDQKKNIEKKQGKIVRGKQSSRKQENRTNKKGSWLSRMDNGKHRSKSISSNHYRKPFWLDYHKRYNHYPKIGARFSLLPRGYISFRIGRFQFFAYHGIYYRYDPVYRVYVVVEKPEIKSNYTSTKWDRVTLMDGSTIEGVYLSGDNENINFEVGDAILEIPKSEIKDLAFSQE